MTNEEKLVLEEGINNAREAMRNSVEYARDCAKAFLDKTEKEQPNVFRTVRKIEQLAHELGNIVNRVDNFDAQIMKIEWIKEKLKIRHQQGGKDERRTH